QEIKNAGMKAGIALNPQTPVEAIKHLLSDLDFDLIMTVNPGFGGQTLIDSCLDTLDDLVALRKSLDTDFDSEVDGGINDETAQLCKSHGANLLVSGSYIFKASDKEKTIFKLKED